MYLDLTTEQQDLAAGARAFLTDAYTPEVVRAAWDAEQRPEALRWNELAEVGFLGLAVPESQGGLGLGDVEVMLILDEAGRVALPGPLLETMVAAMTIAEAGTPAQQERWLGAIATGASLATIALPCQPLVLDADIADVVVVCDGDDLHLVERSGIQATPQPAVDGVRRVFTVQARTDDATLMPGGADTIARLRGRAALGSAAMLLGVSSTLLAMTLEHVLERRQFGRPIGSFQAIKHKLAECYLLLEAARPAVWSAAWLMQEGDPGMMTAVSVAKVHAVRTGRKLNAEALQCHGGVGFAWEHPLHLWLKRGKALEHAYGGAREHRRLVAETIFDGQQGQWPPEDGGTRTALSSGPKARR